MHIFANSPSKNTCLSRMFDFIYFKQNLDFARIQVNPFLHYLQWTRRDLNPRPPPRLMHQMFENTLFHMCKGGALPLSYGPSIIEGDHI